MNYNDGTHSHNKYCTGFSLPLHQEVLLLRDGQDHHQHLYPRRSLEGHAHLEHPCDFTRIH